MYNSMIIIDHLSYSYDRTEALSIENLSIEKGVTTIFLGSNGSGKTTLLKILSGLLNPSKGSINRDSVNLKKNAILVHQIPYLFSGTVGYNIDFVLKIKKLSIDNRKKIIKDSLEQAGIFHLYRRKTSQLSGGEKHRLAIARALAMEPEILVLDEPFAHIDVESRILIEHILEKRANSGKTTVLSTHDLALAYRLADRIIYLENGKIKEQEFNFLKGFISKRDEHFCSFLAGTAKEKVTILAPVSDGNYKVAVIPYSDIILSKDRIESSAQNQLSGEITGFRKSGSQYFITVNCGVEITAIITDRSASKFQLEEKKKIFVNFKASAVRLY